MSHVAKDSTPIDVPFRRLTSLMTGAEAFSDFIFEPLEAHDATPSYVKAKVRVPYDSRVTQDLLVLNILLYKIVSRLSENRLLRNMNIYYHCDTISLSPGSLLLLTSHRIKDGWLQADVSSAEGSLLASASAICTGISSIERHDRSLGSPIVFPQHFRAVQEEGPTF